MIEMQKVLDKLLVGPEAVEIDIVEEVSVGTDQYSYPKETVVLEGVKLEVDLENVVDLGTGEFQSECYQITEEEWAAKR